MRYHRLKVLMAFICLNTFFFKVHSQIDFENYKPLYCSGEIPENLKELSSAKAKDAISEIRSKKVTRKDRMQEQEHAIEVSFLEDQLLTSGQVLFGDPMTNYVNKVADVILKNNPDLKKSIQFFVLRSHIPNAYTTSNGLVFVSIGLLSRLENESQLAVILAHEIQHFVQKHSLEQFKQEKNLKKDFRGSDLEERLKALYRFNKDQELEADDLGYKMLQGTKYDMSEGIYVFEMLKYANFPFLETPMSIDSFESANYKFPEVLKNSIRESIKAGEKSDLAEDERENDDNKSTHPSLNKRILILKDRIATLDNTGKSKFIIGDAAFKEMQKIARYELLLLFVRRGDHGRAYYLTRILELLYEQGSFLSRIKGMSIYALVEHKYKGHNLESYGCNVTDNRGDWRPITSAFASMEAKELSVFAAKELWQISLKYPKDEFILNLRSKVFSLIQNKGHMKLTDFQNFKTQSELKAVSDSTSTVEKPIDKTDTKLKNPRNRATELANSVTFNSIYYYGAFYDLPSKEGLFKIFRNLESEKATNIVDTDKKERQSAAERRAGRIQATKERYAAPNPEFNGLVVFQPKINVVKGNFLGSAKRNYFIEEKTKNSLFNHWKYVAKKMGGSIHIVNNAVNSNLTTDDLNNYAQLNDWLMERLNNDTNEMTLFYSQFIAENMKEYESNYICWVGYDYIVLKKPLQLENLFYSIMFPPLLPIYFYFQFSEDVTLKELTMVYNVNNGKTIMNRRKVLECKLNTDFARAQIYETIYEIKHSKAK